ncbi:MAG: hypothetical protein Tsb002_13430 [Wenzhouxiangellaceae bacterium]
MSNTAAANNPPVSAWLRFFRRCRSVLWTAIFILIVGLAVIVGLGRALTPYAPHLRGWVENQVSQQLGQPVAIGELSADWQGLSPALDLHRLQLTQGDETVQLDHVRLRLNPLNWLLPRRDDWNLEFSGSELSLVRDAEGRWRVLGLPGGSGERDYNSLLDLGDVTIQECRLNIIGGGVARALEVERVILRQLRDGLVLEGLFHLADAAPVNVQMQLDRAGLHAYLEGNAQPVADWFALFETAWPDDLADELPAARADIALWVDLQNSTGDPKAAPRSGQITATLQLQPDVVGEAQASLLDERFSTTLWFDWQGEEWLLTMGEPAAADADPEAAVPWVQVRQDERLIINGANLQLSWLSRLSRWWQSRPAVLDTLDLSGRVRRFALMLDEQGEMHELQADLEQLDYRSGATTVRQREARLEYHAGRGALSTADGMLELPSVFDTPLPVNQLQLAFEYAPGATSWQVRVPQLRLDSGAFELTAAARYVGGDQSWLELTASIPEYPVATALTWLPVGAMSERSGEWLRRGLKQGSLDNIQAVFQGDPADWPFAQGQGTFAATARLNDVALEFNPQWPQVRQLNGRLRFAPKSLWIEEAGLRYAGSAVQRVTASIDDLDAAVLELDLGSEEDAARHLQMLGRLPIPAGAWVDDTQLTLTGPSQIDSRLVVDLRKRRDNTEIEGRVTFKGASADYKDRLQLNELSGSFTFGNDGLRPATLAAQWQQQPAQLQLTGRPFTAALSGYFDIAEVLATAGVDERWQDYLDGRSWWHWLLRPAEGNTRLSAVSDLVGVNVDLPPPLAKFPWTPGELSVEIPFADQTTVQLNYGRQVDAMVALNDAGSVHGIDLRLWHGRQRPPATPPVPGAAVISGSSAALDVMGWADVIETIAADADDDESLITWQGAADFHQLYVLGRWFEDINLSFGRSGEHWGIEFDGPGLLGRVRLPAGDQASDTLLAEFKHIHLPRPLAGSTASSLTDPQQMPALHLFVEDMRWHEWQVGEVQVQAFPVENGLRFETISATSPVFNLNGQGRWVRDAEGVHSQVRLRFDAEQLGLLLESLGYGAVVEGGQTLIELAGIWPNGPADFDLARLNGELEVDVVQGRFPDAGPGAGRMLGLISVSALPRRIMLDFRDVFETGLNFDRLKGKFEIADGFAYTDDLEIAATAAKITIQGRTDLVQREYDQIVSIRPGVGSTLPVIGAIAGGPIGATAGLALQGLLQEPLGGLAEVRYQVSGPWDDPQVTDLPVTPAATSSPQAASADNNGGQGAEQP